MHPIYYLVRTSRAKIGCLSVRIAQAERPCRAISCHEFVHYEDLLEYASDFDFGTDDASEMHISFKILSELIDEKDKELFEDYVCGCAIRAIRDTFALLPVETVFVTAENEGTEILKIKADRNSFEKIKFSYSDPSDIINLYLYK